MLSTKPIIMTSHESQSETVFHRREERLRTMRKMTTIALVATLAALGGCASAEKTPISLANGDAGTSTPPVIQVPAPTPTPLPEELTEVMVTTPTGFIDASSIIDKLVESGCTIDNVKLREVKRGGNLEIKCTHTDALNVKADEL